MCVIVPIVTGTILLTWNSISLSIKAQLNHHLLSGVFPESQICAGVLPLFDSVFIPSTWLYLNLPLLVGPTGVPN